ncbi:hypothetical protein GE061_011750 [Apolygus lucorum]|uniref:Uncharacterized protein n=1 Tax=Apolygus lucorum TaxID=248454 RepID=A0A6A4JLR7_APOLU|nr:hypothetical protein GE061_011750 [Apolygus lucorum]
MKTVSGTRLQDREFSNPRFAEKLSSGSQLTNDTLKKSNKKVRDRSRTIECLNLQTKPRFQKTTTDIFKTFLTGKTRAVELENVPLKRETSSVMERKYPMLKSPPLKTRAPPPIRPLLGSKVSIARSKSEVVHLQEKKTESARSLQVKTPKSDHELSSKKPVSSNENLDENTKEKKFKDNKNVKKGSRKMLTVSENLQNTLNQGEKNQGTSDSVGKPEVSSPSKPQDIENKPSHEEGTKNNKKHKKDTKESKHTKKLSLNTQQLGKLQSKKSKSVDDSKDGLDSKNVNEIISGDKDEGAEIKEPVVRQFDYDFLPSAHVNELDVKSFEAPDRSLVGLVVENPLSTAANVSGDKDSKSHPTGEPIDKEVSFSSVDRPMERRSRDLIFKELLRTNDMLNQIEDPVVPRDSFMTGYPSLSSMEPHESLPNDDVESLSHLRDESSRELLPTISSTTVRLLSIYEPRSSRFHKNKSEKQIIPPQSVLKDEKPSIVDQKTLRNLDVITKVFGELRSEMDVRKTRSSCRCRQFACFKKKKHRKRAKKLLPKKFKGNVFMKYFCKDWTEPKKLLPPIVEEEHFMKDSSQQPAVVADEGLNLDDDSRSGFSDVLDQIEDDEIYDIIFTYKLPKSAPFDLKDTVNEARFKCIHNWLREAGNAAYKLAFEEEIKAKAEEKINEQLMAEMESLRRKIKKCDICNAPSATTRMVSVSTIEMREEAGVQDKSDISTISETEIRLEYRNLMRKLHQSVISYEDDELVENVEVEESTSNPQENGDSDQPLIKPSVVVETRGGKRRREIREILETLIELLKKKLKKMTTRQIMLFKEEDEEGEMVTIEKDLSFKSCHCQDFVDDAPPKLPVNHLDAILAHLPVNISQFLKKRSVCSKPDHKPKRRRKRVKNFSARNRLQLYLMNLLKTWQSPDSQHGRHYDPVRDKRLIEKLDERNFKMKTKKVRAHYKNKPKVRRIPKALRALTEFESTDHDTKISTPHTTKARESIDESKRLKIPFSCSCFCDRISRLNPKRNQHFRTVLNEHFWCLRTDARLLDKDFVPEKSSIQIPSQILCPPQVAEEPDNFQGWLADTDRNLLLIMNRSPLDRVDKDYYKHTKVEKKVQLPVLNEADDANLQKQEDLQNLVNKLSRAHAVKFWETVDRWYEDYKKRDKIRQLLELFKTVDLNAMLQRDLATMKEALAKELEVRKDKIRTRVEQEKKKKFENDVSKLNVSYSCRMKNRLIAKRREMKSKKTFLVRCMLVEAKENFAPIIEKYKKKCTEWIENLRDKQNQTSLLANQRRARELALMADKYDIAERIRRKLVGSHGKEHEEVEKILGQAVEARDVVIEGLKRQIVNVTRDVNIWRRAVGEVLKSFKKFVYYILETRPSRAQYVLNLERLYQIQMDDLIRDAKDELEKVETNEIKTTGRPGEPLQPTMEIKCPSHDIRYPDEHSSKTGSSSDTDIEGDIRARKVVDHAVDALIRAVLPTREPSEEEEEDGDDLKDLERVIRLWELDNSQELKIESVSDQEEVECEEDEAEHERLVHVIGEGASDPSISVEEFTKRRIREMLEIIARKKSLIRPHVHL